MLLGGYMDKQIGAAQNKFQLKLNHQHHQLLGQELLLLVLNLQLFVVVKLLEQELSLPKHLHVKLLEQELSLP